MWLDQSVQLEYKEKPVQLQITLGEVKGFLTVRTIIKTLKRHTKQELNNRKPNIINAILMKREEDKLQPIHRSNSGVKAPTKFIQRVSSEQTTAVRPLATTFVNQNQNPLGQSLNNSHEQNNSNSHSDQTTNNSLLNISDGLPQVQSINLHSQQFLSTQQMGLGDDDDNLLLAPSKTDRESITETDFLDAINEEEKKSTTTTGRVTVTSPRKSSAKRSPRGSPVMKSARKKAAGIRASIASIAGLSQKSEKDTIKVIIRVRPINDREKAGGKEDKVKLCLAVENNQKIVLDRGQEQKTFTFDYVALQESEQHELFDKIAKPIADSCLQGYNGTIFAYGQTGSGKTFTIQGPTILVHGEQTLIGASNTGTEQNEKRGIMQRSFEYMFECMETSKLEAKKSGIEMQFLIKSSYLEIYNEQVQDLLDPSSYNLHVREDIKKGVYVEGLLEETVNSVKDMMNLTTRGARNRHTGSTMMNQESSRSHSVLTTIIESKTMNEEGVWQMKSSRFHIIDLAGSERSKATKAEGERLKEAGMINKSLTALGIVINSLVEISEGKNRHVHYRDSKLTFLLRDSLGGNSKTCIIANVTAAAISVGETMSTLNFAQRAKLIKNKAVVNEESSSTISHLKLELRRTKKELAEQTNLLKIAHDQLVLSSQNMPEQANDGENICKVCKSDIAAQNNTIDINFRAEEEFGFNADNFASNASITLNNFGTNGGMSDDTSLMLDLPQSSTPMNTSDRIGFQNNPKLLRQYKQRAIELSAMKERVGKVEKLLSENLENMEFQQKQYEQQIMTMTKSNKDRQSALEASEKNRARDKIIIKFREERIKELEARLGKVEQQQFAFDASNCDSCPSLSKQLEDAQKEIAQWLEVADKNPQAAKLNAENSELMAQKIALQAEIKGTPESFTARIRGLNEMTNNLNSYLKEYCMGRGLDNMVQKLETSYQEMTSKAETLEGQLADKDTQQAEKLRNISDENESRTAALTDKLEHLKATFEAEKVKIEQEGRDQMTRLKADLDVSQAEKGELQKDIFDKVEAEMRQQEYQRGIDQLNQSVAELNIEKETLNTQVKVERENQEKMAEFQRQTEASKTESIDQLQEKMDSEISNLTAVLKEMAQKANQEIQDLEKEVAAIKEENCMHEENSADVDRKLRQIKLENDSLHKQVLETNEEMEEKRRHVREIEQKLNQTIKDCSSKSEQLEQIEQSQKQSMGYMRSQEEGKSKQMGELNAQFALLQAETSTKIQGLESNVAQLTKTSQNQIALISTQTIRLTEMEQNEKSLQGIVSITDSKVEECARFEVDRQLMQKKIEVLTQEVNQMTDQLSQAAREKAQSTVMQATAGAHEELTVKMTSQVQMKDSEIGQLRATITEKDLQIAQTLHQLNQSNSQLRQSQSTDQQTSDSLTAENTSVKQELQQANDQVAKLQSDLKTEKDKAVKEAQKSDLAKAEQLKMGQAMERMVEEVKQEFKKETSKEKFALELEYQTKIQNRENEIRSQFNSNQSSNDQVHVQQQELYKELHKHKMEIQKQKQAKQLALMTMQGQVKLLKQQHQELVNSVQRDLTWKRVGPKIDVIKGLVEQVKLVSLEQASMKQYKQDCRELKEQLAEYKGLAQQLQEEKLSINTRLQENLAYVETAKTQNAEIIGSLQLQLQTSQTTLLDAQLAIKQKQRNSLGAEGPATSEELVERLKGENKQQKEMLQKRETQIKQILGMNEVSTHQLNEDVKRLSGENIALTEQIQRLLTPNQSTNSNATFGNLATEATTQSLQLDTELEKGRHELTGIHDSIARLAENLLKLPGIGHFVGSNEQLKTHFTKHAIPPLQSQTSSATYYATQKIKGIAFVITHIFETLQGRVQECNQMTQEFKRMEQEIQRLQLGLSSGASPPNSSGAAAQSLAQGNNAQAQQPNQYRR